MSVNIYQKQTTKPPRIFNRNLQTKHVSVVNVSQRAENIRNEMILQVREAAYIFIRYRRSVLGLTAKISEGGGGESPFLKQLVWILYVTRSFYRLRHSIPINFLTRVQVCHFLNLYLIQDRLAAVSGTDVHIYVQIHGTHCQIKMRKIFQRVTENKGNRPLGNLRDAKSLLQTTRVRCVVYI